MLFGLRVLLLFLKIKKNYDCSFNQLKYIVIPMFFYDLHIEESIGIVFLYSLL